MKGIYSGSITIKQGRNVVYRGVVAGVAKKKKNEPRIIAAFDLPKKKKQ